jgi:hypothetical protein
VTYTGAVSRPLAFVLLVCLAAWPREQARADDGAKDAPKADRKPQASDGTLPEAARDVLKKLLSDVGAQGAPLERVERSLERQESR